MNATDRSAWIDVKGYMNATSIRSDYFDKCERFSLLIFGASTADCFLLFRSVEVQTMRDLQDIRFVLPFWEQAFLLISLDSFLSERDTTEILLYYEYKLVS